MKNIIVLLGLSGSGKDEVANCLESEYHIPKIHPIDDLKWFLQCHYGHENKERGWLDTQEGKNTPINPGNPDYTFQNLMVDEFHFREKVDPFFTRPYIQQELYYWLSGYGRCVSIRAVRRIHEADTILQKAKEHNTNVVVWLLQRDSHRKESSDCHFQSILSLMMEESDRFKIIDNNGTIEELQGKMRNEYSLIS